jgi:hypothetical protein
MCARLRACAPFISHHHLLLSTPSPPPSLHVCSLSPPCHLSIPLYLFMLPCRPIACTACASVRAYVQKEEVVGVGSAHLSRAQVGVVSVSPTLHTTPHHTTTPHHHGHTYLHTRSCTHAHACTHACTHACSLLQQGEAQHTFPPVPPPTRRFRDASTAPAHAHAPHSRLPTTHARCSVPSGDWRWKW